MAKKKTTIEMDMKVKGASNVEKAFDGVAEGAEGASQATEDLNKGLEGTGKAAAGTKGGLSDMLDGFKAIVMNPIGLTIIALVAAFKFVSDALGSSEEASNKLSQGFSYLQGFIVPLQNAVISAFDFIVDAVSSPGEAFDNMITGIENAVNYWKDNILAPYLSAWKLLGLAIFKQITKIRIAWNNLTGDVEESKELQNKLKDIEEDITANQKIIKDAAETIKNDVVDAVESVVNGVAKYVEEADKLGKSLSALTAREQNLLKIRRQQEVQNAKSLADIEKLKNIRDNEAESLQDRIKANEKIGEIEKNRVKSAMNLAQAELQIVRDRIRLQGKASTEELDQQKELAIAIQELRGESAGIENEQIVNKTALLTEEFDKQAALIDKESELLAIREKDAVILADAQVAAAQRKLDSLTELGLEEKAIFLEQQNQLELAVATADQAKIDAAIETADKLKEEKDKNNKQDIDDAEKVAKKKLEIKAALNDGIINFASSLTSALGEESKTAQAISKVVALTQIGIDTAKAISSLVAASSANPANAVTFGGAGAIQFATGLLAIGSNIAQAYSILKQPAPQIDGGGGGGAGPAPDTQQTAPDLGFDGRSQGAEQFGANLPIRAYVTETDITTSQNTATNIQQLSQIG